MTLMKERRLLFTIRNRRSIFTNIAPESCLRIHGSPSNGTEGTECALTLQYQCFTRDAKQTAGTNKIKWRYIMNDSTQFTQLELEISRIGKYLAQRFHKSQKEVWETMANVSIEMFGHVAQQKGGKK